MTYEVRKNSYVISDNASLLNINFIHNFCTHESYWAKIYRVILLKDQ